MLPSYSFQLFFVWALNRHYVGVSCSKIVISMDASGVSIGMRANEVGKSRVITIELRPSLVNGDRTSV